MVATFENFVAIRQPPGSRISAITVLGCSEQVNPLFQVGYCRNAHGDFAAIDTVNRGRGY